LKGEKRRLARLKEADEMDEHMRAIAERNRYLALGQKLSKNEALSQCRTEEGD
jgi:hypothetical protein